MDSIWNKAASGAQLCAGACRGSQVGGHVLRRGRGWAFLPSQQRLQVMAGWNGTRRRKPGIVPVMVPDLMEMES